MQLSVKQKIRDLLEGYMTQADFAKKYKIRANTLSNQINPTHTSKPSLPVVFAIGKEFPSLSLRWLIVGDKDMWLNDNNETQILTAHPESIDQLKKSILMEKLRKSVISTEELKELVLILIQEIQAHKHQSTEPTSERTEEIDINVLSKQVNIMSETLKQLVEHTKLPTQKPKK